MENQEIPPPSPTRLPVSPPPLLLSKCSEYSVQQQQQQGDAASGSGECSGSRLATSLHHLSLGAAAAGGGGTLTRSSLVTPAAINRWHRRSGSSASNSQQSHSSTPNQQHLPHDDWQANLTTIRERNAVMFNNDLLSDVRFLVGGGCDEDGDGEGSDGEGKGDNNGGNSCTSSSSLPVTVNAHKYVLSIGSSVFYAMFNGGLSENHRDVIRIPDVEPKAFLTLLKYLYSDEVHLSQDTALTTLYAAKKYLVPHLARQCVDYLEVTLTADNACLFLAQSILFDEEGLARRCWQVIDAQAELALRSPCFPELSHQILCDIISRDTLNVREIHVFQAAMLWAEAECTRRSLQPTADNKRSLLSHALFLIRMPLIDVREFADCVSGCGILTQDEVCTVFQYHHASDKPAIPFVSDVRRGLRLSRVSRFQTSACRSNQWRYRGRCDSIQFCVDRRVFLAGYALYGSSSAGTSDSARCGGGVQQGAAYRVSAQLKMGHDKLVATHDTTFPSSASGGTGGAAASKTYDILFPHPQQIDPHVYYTASVVITGSELSFFGQEGVDKVRDAESGVTFMFQASQESTNGTGVQGGQIPDIIYYVV